MVDRITTAAMVVLAFAVAGAVEAQEKPPVEVGPQSCEETSITKPTPFMGNSEEVFVLADGSVWEVGLGEYNYLYEYYPEVLVCTRQYSTPEFSMRMGLLVILDSSDAEKIDIQELTR